MTFVNSNLSLFLPQALSYISRDQTRELAHTSRAIHDIIVHTYNNMYAHMHACMPAAFVDPLERVLVRASLTSLTTSLNTIKPNETSMPGSIFIRSRDYVLSYARIEFARLCHTCPQKILARICYYDDVDFARYAMSVIEHNGSYYTNANIDNAIKIFDHTVPQLERTRCESDISRNNTPSARVFAFLVHHVIADQVIKQISIHDNPNIDMSIICALTISAMHANNVALLELLARAIRADAIYGEVPYARRYSMCAYVTDEVESMIMANDRLRNLVRPIIRSLEHPINQQDYEKGGITYDLRAITLFELDDDYCRRICADHITNHGDYRDIVELVIFHGCNDVLLNVISDALYTADIADYFDTSLKSRPQDVINKILPAALYEQNESSICLLFGVFGIFASMQYPVDLLRALIDNADIDCDVPDDTYINIIAKALKTNPDYDMPELHVTSTAYLYFYLEFGISLNILLTNPNIISIINNARDISDISRVTRYIDFCDIIPYVKTLEQYYTCKIINERISVYAIYDMVLPRFLSFLRNRIPSGKQKSYSRVLFIYGVIFNDDQVVAKALQMGHVVDTRDEVSVSLSHILAVTGRAHIATNERGRRITIDLIHQ